MELPSFTYIGKSIREIELVETRFLGDTLPIMKKEQKFARPVREAHKHQAGNKSDANARLHPQQTDGRQEMAADDEFRNWLLQRYSSPFVIAPPSPLGDQ